jgi:hypothetical protein
VCFIQSFFRRPFRNLFYVVVAVRCSLASLSHTHTVHQHQKAAAREKEVSKGNWAVKRFMDKCHAIERLSMVRERLVEKQHKQVK